MPLPYDDDRYDDEDFERVEGVYLPDFDYKEKEKMDYDDLEFRRNEFFDAYNLYQKYSIEFFRNIAKRKLIELNVVDKYFNIDF